MQLKQKSLIVLLQIIFVGLLTFVYQEDLFSQEHTYRVFGDLSADFGVAKHEQMFHSLGLAVGESEVRHITIVNEGKNTKLVYLKGIAAGDALAGYSDLEITIEGQEYSYYGSGSKLGKKRLNDFIADSRDGGIKTTSIAPGRSKSFVITVSYPENNNHSGKKKSVAFDLEINSKEIK